jgi:hypothetical protein
VLQVSPAPKTSKINTAIDYDISVLVLQYLCILRVVWQYDNTKSVQLTSRYNTTLREIATYRG